RTVDNKNNQNVGSVIFDKNDLKKTCWNNEQLTLLMSRKIFQDLLPEVETLDAENEEFPLLMVEYMDICLGMVKKSATGRIQQLLKRALADTLAGYLYTYILPMIRKSYYAGNILYEDAKELFDLYHEILGFMHTDGVGWIKPKNDIQYEGEPITVEPDPEACSNLVLYPESGALNIPVPFLDDNKNPTSIALPFQNESLFSLFTENSAFILLKYYKVGYGCMSSPREKRGGGTKGNVNKFIKQFDDWLNEAVTLHLDDEKWYPAFGGVLQVIKSLKTAEETTQSSIDYEESDNPIVQLAPISPTSTCSPNEANKSTWSTWEIILICVIFAVLLWLLVGICVVCCRKNYSNYYRDGTPFAVVYKNDKCINQENVPSGRDARQSMWSWKKKNSDPGCPCGGEVDIEGREEEFISAMDYQ
ncbi:GSCOCG00010839001-RA-CDS, partial [Cotesia congregata]